MNQAHPIFPPFSVDDARRKVNVTEIKYGDDADQILEIYGDSDSAKPTLVLIHGGYWRNLFDREHMRPLAVALAQAGYIVVLPEFRRVAGEPDVTLRDLSFALSTLEDREITLIGYSSGGHLALILADKFPAIKKVIGLAPVTDMVESQARELGRSAVREWLGRDADQRPELDPMLLPPIKAKTIFIQGALDERVPIELTQGYIEAMKRHGREIPLVILPETSHFQMMDIPSATYEAIIESLAL
jgi:pimeloyl-ACP methyl ester carboxylesterase